MAEETREVHLYNANDGITGRDSGVYLDHIEAEQAEYLRAKREGREPESDAKNIPYTGMVLRTGAQVLLNGQSVAIPSETDRLFTASKDNEILAEPVEVTTVPVTDNVEDIDDGSTTPFSGEVNDPDKLGSFGKTDSEDDK